MKEGSLGRGKKDLHQQRSLMVVFGNNLSSLLLNVFLESCSLPSLGATAQHKGRRVLKMIA